VAGNKSGKKQRGSGRALILPGDFHSWVFGDHLDMAPEIGRSFKTGDIIDIKAKGWQRYLPDRSDSRLYLLEVQVIPAFFQRNILAGERRF
jgi:hypothetical protein